MNDLAGRDVVAPREGRVDDHLIVAAIGEIAAAAHHDVVDDRLALIGQRQHQAVERHDDALQIDRGEELNSRPNADDAAHLVQVFDID